MQTGWHEEETNLKWITEDARQHYPAPDGGCELLHHAGQDVTPYAVLTNSHGVKTKVCRYHHDAYAGAMAAVEIIPAETKGN